MGKTGINQKQVKSTNQSLIIREIRSHEAISRSALSKALKLSAPSISNNIDDLISRNIIAETGIGKSKFGRKPINLEFNDSYGYVVAVDMISNVIQIAVSDLSGDNIIARDTVEDALNINEEVIERTITAIHEMLRNANIPEEKLLCICIGSPGIINPETNEIVFCPRIKTDKNICFYEMFSSGFQAKVIVKNDVNLATVGEHMFGSGKEHKHFIHIYVDIGTGAGIFINNHIFEGKRGAAGEFGLWMLNISEAVNENHVDISNSIDSHISLFGLLCKAKDNYPDLFAHLGEGDIDMHRIHEYTEVMFNAVTDGDRRIIALVLQSAVELACAIKNMSDFLDIDYVILGGKVLQFGELYMRTLRNFITRNSSDPIEIVESCLGDQAVIFGALGEGINSVIADMIR